MQKIDSCQENAGITGCAVIFLKWRRLMRNQVMILIRLLFILLYGFGFYALFRQEPLPMPSNYPNFDKFAHFSLFFSLSCFSYLVSSDRYFLYAQFPLLFLALSSEWIQSLFLPHRHFSLADAGANISGFLLSFILCFCLWQYKSRLINNT
ncbi:MAG: hypothetical protein GQ532_16580 [Methylomarinum sp.]|nr:hypothetical protein [Methylomarinum sp.]